MSNRRNAESRHYQVPKVGRCSGSDNSNILIERLDADWRIWLMAEPRVFGFSVLRLESIWSIPKITLTDNAPRRT